ncbi:MAG: DNA polymerase III subunit alpha [Phycisphaerae bacterium]
MRCKTNFSFLRGASHPEELVERAAELGYAALAVTDRNTLAGAVRMHCAARAAGIKLIIGADITPIDAPPIVLYATDRASYARLCTIITNGRRRTKKGACAITCEDIASGSPGLIGVVPVSDLTGPHPFTDAPPTGDHPTRAALEASIASYRDVFGDRLYVAAGAHAGADDRRMLAMVDDLARATGVPMVATNDVHYHHPRRRFLQDVVTCVRKRCTLERAGRSLFPNAERHLKTAGDIALRMAAYPHAVARTRDIADRCRFTLDELRYDYPDGLSPPGRTPHDFLAEQTWAGARRRYPAGVPRDVRARIEHELTLIHKLDYEPYFLTVWDIVRFARSRGILCQGRGSAANSAVCYCLGITSVDPDRIDLLFERFVSAERNEPPDIDVDFEHERREEVFQYIYDKYGRRHAAIVAEVITYRPKSAVRDVGKVLGIAPDRVNVLAKRLESRGKDAVSEANLRDAGLDPTDRTVRMFAKLVADLIGFPRHLSQHVGGFVITRGPLCDMVPIENAAMPDRTFIQWDKDDIDALGMLKIDCLALGMLTAIHKCVDLIDARMHRTNTTTPRAETDTPTPSTNGNARAPRTHHDTPTPRTSDAAHAPRTDAENPIPRTNAGQAPRFTVAGAAFAVPLHEDPAVYDMICRADTVGVFQIESRAQMSMLPRLKPRNFYDLVIEVAIVRPGPIQGGMVHPYLRRRSGQEPVTYPNHAVKDVLYRTMGVPLFQEQAMRLAIVAGGFTPGEADQLRRAMGAWRRRGELERFRDKLLAGMRANGLPDAFAVRCFEQIRGFGEYGFPESHAASFALLVYVSAWLKRYHPAAFCAAIINAQPMGFYRPAQLVRDARQHGVTVRPIDVNHSTYDCSLEGDEPTLRLGMRLIKGISPDNVAGVACARRDRPFTSVTDLARRSGASRPVLARLAAAGAMRSIGLTRRQAVWSVLALRDEPELLAPLEPREDDPHLPPMSTRAIVISDYDATGLSLVAHPISLVRRDLARLGVQPARVLTGARHGQRVCVAGLVLVRQRPATAAGIVFYTLEDETGTANLVVRPRVYQRHRPAARGAVAIIADGRVERQGDVVHLQVHRLHDVSHRLADLHATSRDFH